MSRVFGNLEENYTRKYSDRQLLSRYSKYIKQQKTYLIYSLIAIIFSTGFTLLVAFPLQIGIDALGKNENSTVFLMTALFMGTYILIWLSDYIRTYQNTKFTAYSTRDIRQDIFEHVQFHDQSFFDTNNSGFLQSRVMDDTQVLSDFVKLTSDFLVNMLIAIGTFIIMLYLDVRLTLMAASVIPFLVFLAIVMRKIARGLSRDWRKSISLLNDSFAENISGISITRSFARENEQYEKFDEFNRLNYKVNVKRQMFYSSIFPFVYATSNVGIYFVLRYGSESSIKTGVPTVGTLLLYVVLLQRFYFPVILISTFFQQVQSGLAAAERIFSLMDVQSKVRDTGTQEVQAVKGEVDIQHLTFSYDGKVNVFDDFNLKIKPGEKVAIVGHTGAGKSSLISLLTRFYEFQGDILLDGTSVKDYSLHSYRGVLGLVLQEPFIFSGTIRDNIAYGKKGATTEEIIEAAKTANLWEVIQRYPQGLDTEVFERGKTLSQGQRQLIALARAFLPKPNILLMDEATSSIDAYSEALIQEAMDRILKDRTAVIIAHRLTTIKKMDRIVVLDHGKIIEEGTHDSLIEKNGHYADLYRKYFEFQEVEA